MLAFKYLCTYRAADVGSITASAHANVVPLPSHRGLQLWEELAAFISQRADNSQRMYLSVLREFCQCIGAVPGTIAGAERIRNVSPRDVINYRNYIKKLPGKQPRLLMEAAADSTALASDTTVRYKLVLMRTLFKTLHSGGLLPTNPFARVMLPPRNVVDQREPTIPVRAPDVLKLFEACADNPTGVQDAALLAVLFGAGLRCSEVAGLILSDLRETPSGTPYLKLRHTKARTAQQQVLPDWAHKKLTRWMSVRRISGAGDRDRIFCGRLRGKNHRPGMSTRTVTRRIKYLCARVGLDSRLYSSHSGRHTGITRLFELEKNPIDVKNFARHKHLSTTLVYNHARQHIDAGLGRELDYESDVQK